MKVQILSDAHREIYNESGWEPKICKDVDIIICAGDMVGSPQMAKRYFSSMREKTNAKILYVLGNHEYWHWTINGAFRMYFEEVRDIENLEIMNNSFLDLGDAIVYGTTLWTDFAGGTQVIGAVQGMMDHQQIKTYNNDEKPLWAYMTDRFDAAVDDLDHIARAAQKNGQQLVVVSHHAPTYSSVSDKFRGSPLNGAFVSDLDKKIDEWKPTLWVHGHVHNDVDSMVYGTRVICNPCGYPWEGDCYQEELVLEI